MQRASDMFDAIVVGAGYTGMLTALALASRTHSRARVALIDRRDPTAPPPRIDTRASALSRATVNLLIRTGIWPRLEAQACPVARIAITDPVGDSPLRETLLRYENRLDDGPASFIVENEQLRQALVAAIEAQDGLVLLPPAAVTGLDVETHAARLVTEDGDTVTGRVILACDGPSSPLREMAAIRTVGWEYGQAGIVATITHSADHERVAAQHFLPAGPLAMLPLPGRRTSIVWAESTCRARELDALDDKAFTAALAERIGTRLGEIALVTGTRASWPLRLQLARSLTANRLCLFGEAARTVHPLAGQGLNIAARDAAAFADVAGDALALGIDPGNAATLDGYSRARRFDASMSALAFDALNRLFAMRAPIVRSLRDAGLEWVDRSPRLKEIFVREAAGLAGDDVPSLMRNAPARGRQPADAGAL